MQGLTHTVPAQSLLQKTALFHRVLCQSPWHLRSRSRSQSGMRYSKSILNKITMQGLSHYHCCRETHFVDVNLMLQAFLGVCHTPNTLFSKK